MDFVLYCIDNCNEYTEILKSMAQTVIRTRSHCTN